MDNTFILNPQLERLDLIDAINEIISKIKTLVGCLLSASYNETELTSELISGVAWTIEDFIKEMEVLHEHLEKVK
jgi:hypothetical protein